MRPIADTTGKHVLGLFRKSDNGIAVSDSTALAKHLAEKNRIDEYNQLKLRVERLETILDKLGLNNT